MCIFSRVVEHVSATKIFARGLPDGRQVLIYAMDFAAAEDVAMILPLPVVAGGDVAFVDLSGYGELFTDLAKAFPASFLFAAQGRGELLDDEGTLSLLEVHQVGAFEASFVPTARDFGRLDPRFRVPASVLPGYPDWGFAVFQLRGDRDKTSVHPMALVFPSREPGALFYPTVHVHDGNLPATAHFDHRLYAQLPPLFEALLMWDPSTAPLGSHVDGARTRGLVDGTAGGHATTIHGEAPNRDVWLRPPAGIAERDVVGAGESYAYRVRATYHFETHSHHQYPRWLETAQHKLPALCAALRDGLAELTARNLRAWQLAPLHDRLRPHFMNGMQLWSGTDYVTGSSTLSPGPGRIAFRPFTQLVEPQDVTLGFAELPTPEDAVDIHRALGTMLDRYLG